MCNFCKNKILAPEKYSFFSDITHTSFYMHTACAWNSASFLVDLKKMGFLCYYNVYAIFKQY